MAKRDYTRTKLALTGAFAGLTMLTAGWLAQPQANADDGLAAAEDDVSTAEVVASYATATPTTSSSGSAAASTSATSTVSKPVATATAAAAKAATTTTAKTTKAS